MTRSLLARFSSLAVFVVAGSPLNAQAPKEVLPSFKADQVFEAGTSIENLSLFSGDVQLSVPIGPTYTLSGSTTFRLTANYSTRFWNHYSDYCGNPDPLCGTPGMIKHAVVTGNTTLGVGWSLTVGYITGAVRNHPDQFPVGPRYHAPDGTVHTLVQKVGDPYYTADDGFFARFYKEETPVERWRMDLPDGQRWYFDALFNPPVRPNGFDFYDGQYVFGQPGHFGLRSIEDPFGAPVLTVDYRTAPDSGWQVDRITMGTREIQFNWTTFQTAPIPNPFEPARTWQVLESISFPILGTQPNEQRLLVTFDRIDGHMYRIPFASRAQNCTEPLEPYEFRVPHLSGITASDQSYAFEYGSTAGEGVLSAYRLPTGGRVSFEYLDFGLAAEPCPRGSPNCGSVFSGSPLTFESREEAQLNNPDPSCAPFSPFIGYLDHAPVVSKRTEFDPVTFTTSVNNYRRMNMYEAPNYPNDEVPDPNRVVRLVVAERPNGNGGMVATKHFFSVQISGGPTGIEMGRQHYAGTNVTVPPIREQIFCHEYVFITPQVACGPLDGAGRIGQVSLVPNRRQIKDVTWFGDHSANPGAGEGGLCSAFTATAVACWQKEWSGYVAGAQEYATETISAPTTGPSLAFLGSGQTSRQTTTTWTPDSGTSRWLPKRFNKRVVRDYYSTTCPFPLTRPLGPPQNYCEVETNYAFSADTGALTSTTVTDPLTNRSRTESFGYVNGVPTTQTISATESGDSFTTSRTFSGGLVTTSRRTSPNLVWNSFAVDRDPALGLITTSYDPNGVPTSYTYDLLGRLTGIAPTGTEADSVFCYFPWNPAVPSAPAYVVTKRGGSLTCDDTGPSPAEGSGTASAFFFDGLGRVTREVRLLPTETAGATYLAVKHTRRTSGGFVTAESEWTPCGSGTSFVAGCSNAFPSSFTSYGNFDAFGRPRAITLPDTTAITKAYDDIGIPNSDFRDDTTTPNVAGGSTIRSVRKDLFGRPIAVSEPKMTTDPDFFGPINFYDYDVHDKLAGVRSGRLSGGGSVDQVRTWSYDPLGNLRSETHPERGTTDYSRYTALGNPRTVQEGSGAVTRTTTYDAIGRVTKVAEGTVESPGATYLENWYDGTDGGGHASPLGRLTKSIGYNPGAFENARVEESYSYGGLSGRLSSKTTTVRRGTSGNPILHAVTESFTWNDLGLLAKHDLPGASGNVPLSVETFYSAGMPTRVAAGGLNVATGVTYHPHGGLKSYTTANGVTTTLAMPTNLMARVARVSTTGATTNLDTGAFKYDGAGNVTEMRLSPSVADVFTYDRLSRLKTSMFGTLAGSPKETFFYDGDQEKGFGNLIARKYEAGTTTDVDLAANMLTNRLISATYDDTIPAGRGLMTQYGPDHFAYDARNRRTAYDFNFQRTEDYLYAGTDERLVKRVVTSTLPLADPGPLRYFPLTPCRILDTRNAVGTYGGPSLQGQLERSFPTVGTCAIPSKASALALTITAVPKAGFTLTTGSLGAWRSDLGYRPNTLAAVVNPSRPRATFAIIGLSGTGSLNLFPDIPASESTDAVVDVSGYFAPPIAPPSSGRSWLITYRDAENHPAAEYRFDEDRSGVILPQRFHVYLGSTLVATREEAFNASYGGFWSYFSSDHLGTPRLRTGVLAAGQGSAPALETYRYRAFGAKFPSLVQPDRDGREFALMERDTASGNHYVHARFYTDWSGRFLSPDQVNGSPEDPQSWNRYAYGLNNPLKYVDPDGRNPLHAVSNFFTGAASSIIGAGSVVQSFGGALNGGGALGIAADATVGTLGSVVQGFGDLLNLGTSTGDAIGSGADGFNFTIAASADLGRASGIVLTVAAGAQARGVPSTTLGSTTVTTAEGAITVPGGYVRSIAQNGKGVFYSPPGSSGNAGIVRVAGPSAQSASGYARVYNKQGQPIVLSTGKPGSRAATHPALAGGNTVKPVKVIPATPPCTTASPGGCGQ